MKRSSQKEQREAEKQARGWEATSLGKDGNSHFYRRCFHQDVASKGTERVKARMSGPPACTQCDKLLLGFTSATVILRQISTEI